MKKLLLIFLLLATPASAQIAFDAATDGSYNAGSGNLTFAHTTAGSNRVLIVCIVGNNGADAITSVTYNGVSMTMISSFYTGFINRRTSNWILINPDSGTHNVVITISATQYLWGSAVSYTGVKQTGQPNAHFEQGNFSPLTSSVTTTENDAWLICFESGYPGSVTTHTGVERTHDATSGFDTWWLGDTNGSVGVAGSYSFSTARPASSGPFEQHNLIALTPATGATPVETSTIVPYFF